jgi:hypothetical protein
VLLRWHRAEFQLMRGMARPHVIVFSLLVGRVAKRIIVYWVFEFYSCSAI